MTIELPTRLLDEIEADCRRLGQGVCPPDADYGQIARDATSAERAREEITRLLGRLGVEGRGLRMLEIGSGYGMGLAIARSEFEIEAFGVEPSEQFSGTYQCSLEILRRFGCPEDAVRRAVGEALPFADASFDIVYSSNVLEHVDSPEAVFAEALRVLRPGGHLCFVVPNYGSWFEGHYGILWIPHLQQTRTAHNVGEGSTRAQMPFQAYEPLGPVRAPQCAREDPRAEPRRPDLLRSEA